MDPNGENLLACVRIDVYAVRHDPGRVQSRGTQGKLEAADDAHGETI